jgi:ABC-2 type transport system ATP-binding protein
MKRRINLIAGIMHEPKIVFLDEPTVGVDVQSRNVITEYLHELSQRNCTIIYTSHLMDEAENLCSDIAIIDSGKIIAEGKPADMILENKTDNLEALFLKLTGKKLRD